VDVTAMDLGLIVYSTMPTRDGYAGDQTLFAPPFTTTDAELTQMVERFAETIKTVTRSVESELK
jgi:adenosylmethionine-8-amino-7-oxononanoate aminotransferase